MIVVAQGSQLNGRGYAVRRERDNVFARPRWPQWLEVVTRDNSHENNTFIIIIIDNTD